MSLFRKPKIGDHLPPKTLAVLEARGAVSIRATLNSLAGGGQGAEVKLEAGLEHNPSRAQVELWLQQKASEAAARETWRYRHIVFWAVVAAIAGIAALLKD